jgi:hypothetical protein
MSSCVADQDYPRCDRIVYPCISVRVTLTGTGDPRPSDFFAMRQGGHAERLEEILSCMPAGEPAALLVCVAQIQSDTPPALREHELIDAIVHRRCLLIFRPISDTVDQ